MTTKSKAELFLLGEPVSVLTGSKQPQLHNYASFAVTITKIANECLKKRIPIKQSPNCQTKLDKVFKE